VEKCQISRLDIRLYVCHLRQASLYYAEKLATFCVIHVQTKNLEANASVTETSVFGYYLRGDVLKTPAADNEYIKSYLISIIEIFK